MDQHTVEIVGVERAQALFDGRYGVIKTEVEARFAVLEDLPDLGHDDPVPAPCAQQATEPLLAASVGRCRVEQVDAEFPGEIEQLDYLPVVRKFEGTRILYLLVAPELDRAQPQRTHLDAGAPEWSQVHCLTSSQGSRANGGVGYCANAARPPDGFNPRSRSPATTSSATRGAKASLVGQQVKISSCTAA